MLTDKLLFTILLLIPVISNAATPLNSIELSTSGGLIDKKRTEELAELNDLSAFHITLGYMLNINDYIAFGVSYLKGNSSAMKEFSDFFTDSRIEYEASELNLRFSYPVGLKGAYFLKFSGGKYEYDLIDDEEVFYSNDGKGWAFGAGWKRKWKSGVGLTLGYEYREMGSEIKLDCFTIGPSYSF